MFLSRKTRQEKRVYYCMILLKDICAFFQKKTVFLRFQGGGRLTTLKVSANPRIAIADSKSRMLLSPQGWGATFPPNILLNTEMRSLRQSDRFLWTSICRRRNKALDRRTDPLWCKFRSIDHCRWRASVRAGKCLLHGERRRPDVVPSQFASCRSYTSKLIVQI